MVENELKGHSNVSTPVEKPEAASPPKMSLKQGVLTVMSLMIGSGIFSNANKIQAKVKSSILSLGLFLLTGLLSLTGALCYAELGTMIPGSGGEAQYLGRGIGAWAAALFDWTSIILMKPGSLPVFALVFAEHLRKAIECVRESPLFPLKSSNDNFDTAFAAVIIWFITFAAMASVKRCDQIVSVLTYSKIIGLASVVIIGFINFFREPVILGTNLKGEASQKFGNFNLLDFSYALYDGLWAFDGWNNLNIVAGNLENPKRNLPLAIWISVSVVLAMYLAAMLGYYAVLDKNGFRDTEALAVDFGRIMFGKFGSVMFALIVCASVFAAALSGMTTSSEIITLSAKRRFFPKFLERINSSTGTAVNAYLSQGILATFFLIIPRFFGNSTFEFLVDTYMLPTWLFYGMCVVILLMMRFTEPKLERPYKVWPTTPLMFLVAAAWLIVVAFIKDWRVPTIAFTLVLLGLPMYFMRRGPMTQALLEEQKLKDKQEETINNSVHYA
jgi:amino acid transporter